MTSKTQRLATLHAHLPVLKGIMRGIEKEGLRVDNNGQLAATPHPRELGSALTNPRITTDYSEALLELITGTQTSVEKLLAELTATHRFVAQQLDGKELIWNQSMPAHLPREAAIPIAWYGTSNSGMLKHVYRRGLAERYGKAMQCIAGVHYNFSLPDELWALLSDDDTPIQEKRTTGYLALIRNFSRNAWLLMYLFGDSPAASGSFMQGIEQKLQKLHDDTYYLPHATSLRMSDVGYQNDAQSSLHLCYNDLDTFVRRIHQAVSTPWPAYEKIGTHRNGEWIQLNCNQLQIENEFYSSIRPKRTTHRGERPSCALYERGVQYIEVRCLDIDSTSPIGITAQTSHFMDAFLLYCAMEDSPFFPQDGHCQDSSDNFSRVAKEGRKPGLMLIKQNTHIRLEDWAKELIEQILPYAELLDSAYETTAHTAAVMAQVEKITDSENTPSARFLQQLRDSGLSAFEYTLEQSKQHHRALVSPPLEPELLAEYQQLATRSLNEQRQMEESDTVDFDTYVARYHAALNIPCNKN